MRKEVYDYFKNLDYLNLTDKHHVFHKDNHRIDYIDQNQSNVVHLKVDYLPMYMKKWKVKEAMYSLSSAEMYHKLGILTPPMKPAIVNLHEDDQSTQINQIFMQDAKSIGLYCVDANTTKLFEDFINLNPKSKWEILYNSSYRELFLNHMTEECFEEYINMFLLDHLRSDSDRYYANFLLFRRYLTSKFEGIIPIDLDESRAIDLGISNKEEFQSFLNTKDFSFIPSGIYGPNETYKKRTEDIQQLIQDEKLSNSQIELLRDALRYNLPKTTREMGAKYSVDKETRKQISTPTAYLWDYNRKTIGKELGL